MSNDKWERVYYPENRLQRFGSSKNAEEIYNQYKESNRQEYDNLKRKIVVLKKENGYGITIDDCVENAIESGNHAMFAYYFTKVAKFNRELFAAKLEEYIAQQPKDFFWSNIQILKSECWRLLSFEYNLENIEENQCSETMLSNWKNGVSIPDRDVIIQFGFYLNLNAREVNELLVLVGHVKLYILDIVDAISMYYLDYYKVNDNDKNSSSNISVFDKIAYVKGKINYYLSMEYENNKDKFVVLNKLKKEKGKREGFKVLAYKEAVGWNIDEEINTCREILQKDSENTEVTEPETELDKREIVGNTMYLTKQFESRYKDCDTEQDFEEFLREGQKIFAQKQYGYLHKMKSFLKNHSNYLKNFRFSDEELIVDRKIRIDNFGQGTIFITKDCKRIYEKIANNKEIKRDVTLLETVYTISCLKNVLDKDLQEGESQSDNLKGNLIRTRQLIEGRNIAKDNYEIEDDSVKKAYRFNIGKKSDIVKFCLAAGQEEYLWNYLKLAGFWLEDLYEKNTECYEKLDSLLIYAMKYRDVLIEKWTNNGTAGVSKTEFKSELRKKFPMIKMIMTINRDIQFVLKEFSNKKNIENWSKEIYEHLAVMVYPVKSSSCRWFEGYEKFYAVEYKRKADSEKKGSYYCKLCNPYTKKSKKSTK